MNTLISNAGMHRNHSVRIAHSQTTLTNYLSVPDRMSELVAAMNRPIGEGADSIIERMARTHAQFEQIHPFSDGNGRVGRLIMLIQALQNRIVPPLIVKERASAYYKYLETAQLRDEYELLRLFIAESILFTESLINL
jgi:Fic family protein